MGGTEAARWSRLQAREQAAEMINRTFGLNVSVRFRTGTYINAQPQDEVEVEGEEV
jgi:hypothetical protein